jgi:thioesterase domain-containing protein
LPYPGHDITDDDERLIIRMLGALPQGQSRLLHAHLRTLPDHAARIDYLFQAGRAVGRIPASYTVNDLRRMYDGMAAHVEALSTYRPHPYSGRVTFLRCQDRSESDIAAYIAWSAIARQGVRRFDVPGKHSTVLEEPQVQQVAEILQRCLREEEPIA